MFVIYRYVGCECVPCNFLDLIESCSCSPKGDMVDRFGELGRWCRPLCLLLIWVYLVWYVAIFILASKKNCFRFLFWIQWFFSWIVFVVVCIVFDGCACCEFGFFCSLSAVSFLFWLCWLFIVSFLVVGIYVVFFLF